MYSLKYEMMLQVLHQLGSSGEFRADIPSQAALKEGGVVILRVLGGKVISCIIANKHGQKLYHDADAERLLPRFGILDWQLISPAVPEMKPVEKKEDLIPMRHIVVPPAEIHSWAPLQRSVYLLADGTRTVEQIAKLLSRPVQTIEQILHYFETSGIIRWYRR